MTDVETVVCQNWLCRALRVRLPSALPRVDRCNTSTSSAGVVWGNCGAPYLWQNEVADCFTYEYRGLCKCFSTRQLEMFRTVTSTSTRTRSPLDSGIDKGPGGGMKRGTGRGAEGQERSRPYLGLRFPHDPRIRPMAVIIHARATWKRLGRDFQSRSRLKLRGTEYKYEPGF